MSINLNLSTPITSMIRIAVAAVVGTVVRILSNKYGVVDIDGETLVAVSTGAVVAVYYALAKLVEAKYPRVRPLGLADPDTKT